MKAPTGAFGPLNGRSLHPVPDLVHDVTTSTAEPLPSDYDM
jgi:hypothetical protein